MKKPRDFRQRKQRLPICPLLLFDCKFRGDNLCSYHLFSAPFNRFTSDDFCHIKKKKSKLDFPQSWTQISAVGGHRAIRRASGRYRHCTALASSVITTRLIIGIIIQPTYVPTRRLCAKLGVPIFWLHDSIPSALGHFRRDFCLLINLFLLEACFVHEEAQSRTSKNQI